MGLRKPGEVEDQMCSFCSSSLSLLKHHLVVIYGLVAIALLIFSGFSSHSLFTSFLVTFVVLIVSTFARLTFTKQKLGLKQKPVFEGTSSEVKVLGEENIIDKEIITQEELRSENEIVTTKKEAHLVDETPGYIVKLPPLDLSSESESMDLSSTSEDSDADWPFPNNMARIPECSDDSISDDDDENLIEIPLSSDDYCFGLKEEHKLKSQLSLSQLYSDSVFSQKGLLEELLAEINEMNEEDNLIEIDLSMGSIKCSSGLEIQA